VETKKVLIDLDLLEETAYLLLVPYLRKGCPNWVEGVGGCGECIVCRTENCWDALEDIIEEAKENDQ
jgi:hypothetical protein